jgi:Tfp pilus assembly protein PilV
MARASRNSGSFASSETGVTLIEMVIAILVLTVGLIGLAQLFIVASFNNSYAIATSGGVNDAQRLIEDWKTKARSNINHSSITSSTYDETNRRCAAFVALGYDPEASPHKESVWVFDRAGNLVGSASPSYPPDVPSGTLRAVSDTSRLVYIRMEPKTMDPRYGQTVTISTLITQE